MPAEANTRREVLGRIRQRLTVVAEAEVDGDIASQVNAVLHKTRNEPLPELIEIVAKTDRLCVILDVIESQLVERRSSSGLERERTQNGGAGLTAGSA